MARSGLMDNGADPTGAPTYPTGGLSDVLSATMLAFGVLGAFLTRVRHGDAPTVDAAQLSALLWLQNLTLTTLFNTGRLVQPFDRQVAGNPLRNIYQCAGVGRAHGGGSQPARRLLPG